MASREINILIRAKNLAGGAIAGVKKDLRGINRDISRGLGNAARNIERGVMIAGAAAVGGLVLAVKTAVDFETAFAGVEKTVDATATTSMPALRAELEKLSSVKPQSFEELSQIAEFGGQLGVGADEIAGFTDTISDFLVAVPAMGLEEAAFGLERVRLLTGAARDELDETASVVVELGNNFSTTESAIIGTAERFASSAKQADLSTAATLGLAAAVTALGGEPQEAGTSLQRLFQNINLALAKGGDKADLFAEVAGQSAADFRDSWEKDAEGTLLRFLGGLGELSDDGIEQTRILDELGLADARLGKNVLNLANNMDVTTAAIDAANDEWIANGALTEEAEKRYKTAEAQFGILKNRLRLIAATIGNEVLPVVLDLAKEFSDFLMQPGTQAGIKQFAEDVGQAARDAAEWLRSLDWEAIGNSLKMAAGFAKGVVDAFLSMPSWVQQAVISGWGLNKLTGGALGSIVGSLASGLIKGVLGINAGVVNVNAATVNGMPGGGVAGAAGKGGLAGTLLKGGLAVAGGAVIGAHVGSFINEEVMGVKEAREFETGQVDAVLASKDAARIERAIQVIEDQLAPEDIGAQVALALDINGVRTTLESQRDALQEQLGAMGVSRQQAAQQIERMDALKAGIGIAKEAQVAEIRAMKAEVTGDLTTLQATTAAASAHSTQKLSDVRAETAALHGTLRGKNFSPNVNVTSNTSVTANISVSASQIAQSIRIDQRASQTSPSYRGGESRY